MRTIFNIALDNKHDCIILSAFGCGAYGNPATYIARLFKEVIQQEFHNKFKMIVFAIYDQNPNLEINPNGCLKPFADVFKMEAVKQNDLFSK